MCVFFRDPGHSVFVFFVSVCGVVCVLVRGVWGGVCVCVLERRQGRCVCVYELTQGRGVCACLYGVRGGLGVSTLTLIPDP